MKVKNKSKQFKGKLTTIIGIIKTIVKGFIREEALKYPRNKHFLLEMTICRKKLKHKLDFVISFSLEDYLSNFD